MHDAPSVNYPVGRSFCAGVLVLALWLFGLVSTAVWSWQAGGPGWRQGTALAWLAFAGFWAGHAWRRTPAGELGWDGYGWRWSGAPAPDAGSVSVGIDLQRVLLLRWKYAGGVRWFWLESASAPERWRDLRRAVYSRANPETLPGAAQPAVKP